MTRKTLFLLFFCLSNICIYAQYKSFFTGDIWKDAKGVHINAHGGGIVYHDGTYYWYGENKGERSNNALVGVMCYSSTDLYNWTNEGVALPVSDDPNSPIVRGSIIERPKVIYNEKTKKFVMYFHLELKGKGYAAANVGVAISDTPTGEFKFLKNSRVNAGIFPLNMTEEQQKSTVSTKDFPKWWTDEWRKAVVDGLFVRNDLKSGQMNRDMTLFVDEDGKAYHIYSSEENLTLQIAELTDDYLDYTGKYVRVAPGGHNEGPAIFKKGGKYYMITSGCTGWDPNEARMFSADNIFGPWKQHPNPCVGNDAELTFHSQSTYILPVAGKKDAFIFMGDRWTPKNPIDGRYIWLPIFFGENDLPVLKWLDNWDLSVFEDSKPTVQNFPIHKEYKLVWADEFDTDGAPNPEFWGYENGFVRNNEDQWYQPKNAVVKNGILTITAKKEQVKNPNYDATSQEWRKKRKNAEITAASINTRGKKEFLYGRFEVRAKVPTASGAWPAIWTLGTKMPWPSCGEIDIMEFYRINDVPHILANAAWGTGKPGNAKWNSAKIPFTHFTEKDPAWASKFHTWRMDWDETAIQLFLDDELLNTINLAGTKNGGTLAGINPFQQSHYLLLNLAIGGDNGGKIDLSAFPLKYEIDYVRVYQQQ